MNRENIHKNATSDSGGVAFLVHDRVLEHYSVTREDYDV